MLLLPSHGGLVSRTIHLAPIQQAALLSSSCYQVLQYATPLFPFPFFGLPDHALQPNSHAAFLREPSLVRVSSPAGTHQYSPSLKDFAAMMPVPENSQTRIPHTSGSFKILSRPNTPIRILATLKTALKMGFEPPFPSWVHPLARFGPNSKQLLDL